MTVVVEQKLAALAAMSSAELRDRWRSLGAAATVTLISARQLAGKIRDAIALGVDPRSVLNTVPAHRPEIPTFAAYAEGYVASVEKGWKSDIHRQQWRSSLRDHARSLADVSIDQVDTAHVLAVLRPIWLAKAETARRLRGRIERILDAARVDGHRPAGSANPAAWHGHLALMLASQKQISKGHHAALPLTAVPAFMALLRQRPALSARCLEFVILTAARSGEALGATWREIHLETRTWIIPAARMKANKEHHVPLSDDAMAVLQAVAPPSPNPDDRVFAVAGATRSNMAMAMLLRRMDFGEVTTHGFRSTFRDWAGERTDFPREYIEHALAHGISDKTEAAYRRGTGFKLRSRLMSAWTDVLAGRIGVDDMVSCIPVPIPTQSVNRRRTGTPDRRATGPPWRRGSPSSDGALFVLVAA